MNERLKQLMLDAGYAAPEIAARAQHLALLVIQDCISTVATRCIGDHNREDAEVKRCVDDLKQRWGLE